MKKSKAILCLPSSGIRIFKWQFCQFQKKLKIIKTEYNGRENSFTSTEQYTGTFLSNLMHKIALHPNIQDRCTQVV